MHKCKRFLPVPCFFEDVFFVFLRDLEFRNLKKEVRFCLKFLCFNEVVFLVSVGV